MIEKWIVRHWKALCSGCVLMGIAIRAVYASRGYIAIGGEWAIIPIAFLIEQSIRARRREARRRCRNIRT